MAVRLLVTEVLLNALKLGLEDTMIIKSPTAAAEEEEEEEVVVVVAVVAVVAVGAMAATVTEI
jgi:hypothetical protein